MRVAIVGHGRVGLTAALAAALASTNGVVCATPMDDVHFGHDMQAFSIIPDKKLNPPKSIGRHHNGHQLQWWNRNRY